MDKLERFKTSLVLLTMNRPKKLFHLYRIFLALIKKKEIPVTPSRLMLLVLRQYKKVSWAKNREKYLAQAQDLQMKAL